MYLSYFLADFFTNLILFNSLILGDIPSKLEVMVKTARDLSNSSVLNGK